jgi:hypothetical protein
VSWWAVLTLAAGAFAFKAAGMFGIGRYVTTPRAVALAALLPSALLAALVVLQTFTIGTELTVDARAAGVAAGAVAVWRHAPFWLVVSIAAAVTALLRVAS